VFVACRFQVGNYVVVRRIGAGSFAHVYRGYHKTNGMEVAIKGVDREKMNLNKKHQENLESEISIMKKLQHPNIVRLYDIIVSAACGGLLSLKRVALSRTRSGTFT
jgi:serine/threonine-protein kinase ULK/ATG1